MKETEISRLYDRKIVYEASREKKKSFSFVMSLAPPTKLPCVGSSVECI